MAHICAAHLRVRDTSPRNVWALGFAWHAQPAAHRRALALRCHAPRALHTLLHAYAHAHHPLPALHRLFTHHAHEKHTSLHHSFARAGSRGRALGSSSARDRAAHALPRLRSGLWHAAYAGRTPETPRRTHALGFAFYHAGAHAMRTARLSTAATCCRSYAFTIMLGSPRFRLRAALPGLLPCCVCRGALIWQHAPRFACRLRRAHLRDAAHLSALFIIAGLLAPHTRRTHALPHGTIRTVNASLSPRATS